MQAPAGQANGMTAGRPGQVPAGAPGATAQPQMGLPQGGQTIGGMQPAPGQGVMGGAGGMGAGGGGPQGGAGNPMGGMHGRG